MNDPIKKHTISLYVNNKPGVLIRISLVFARRGFNIDSLVVSEAHDPAFSRMNLVVTGDERTFDQMLKQLNKLVDVVHAIDYEGKDVIQKELALIKINATSDSRTEILQIGVAFKCRTVDIGDSTITFQVSGSTEKLDAVHKLFNQFGVVEMIRTGKVLMARGDETTA